MQLDPFGYNQTNLTGKSWTGKEVEIECGGSVVGTVKILFHDIFRFANGKKVQGKASPFDNSLKDQLNRQLNNRDEEGNPGQNRVYFDAGYGYGSAGMIVYMKFEQNPSFRCCCRADSDKNSYWQNIQIEDTSNAVPVPNAENPQNSNIFTDVPTEWRANLINKRDRLKKDTDISMKFRTELKCSSTGDTIHSFIWGFKYSIKEVEERIYKYNVEFQ